MNLKILYHRSHYRRSYEKNAESKNCINLLLNYAAENQLDRGRSTECYLKSQFRCLTEAFLQFLLSAFFTYFRLIQSDRQYTLINLVLISVPYNPIIP